MKLLRVGEKGKEKPAILAADGKIRDISGENINKKATIFFEGVGQKQLLLRFAKLEIIKE